MRVCGQSTTSFSLVHNGAVSICFLNTVLYAIHISFLLLFGSLRIKRLLTHPIVAGDQSGVEIRFFKYSMKKNNIPIILSLLIFVIPGVIGFTELVTLDFDSSIRGWSIFFTTLETLSWIYNLFVLRVENQRVSIDDKKYAWVLPFWWVSAFILSSLNLQALIGLKSEGFNTSVDIALAALNLFFSCMLSIYGLYFFRKEGNTSYHQVMNDISDSQDTIELSESKESPELRASIFSKAIFTWMTPLLYLGHERALEERDLYEIPPDLSANYGANEFELIWRKEMKKSSPSLLRAIAIHLWSSAIIGTGLQLIHDLVQFVGPNMIGLIVGYIQDPSKPVHLGVVYIFILMVSSFTEALSMNHRWALMQRVSIKARAALLSTIYRKSFHLSSSARQKATVGEIVNLQAIDTRTIQDLVAWTQHYWSTPFQISVAMYFLWQNLGVATLGGVGVMCIVVPLNFLMARRQSKIQSANMERKDNRIKLLNEVLNAIRVIKIFTWEKKFVEKIIDIRSQELVYMRKYALLEALSTFLWSATPLLVSMAAFSIYALLGNELTASKVFESLALFNILRLPLNMLPELINMAVTSRVSFRRIREYLLQEELDSNAVEYHPTMKDDKEPVVEIRDGTFQWEAVTTLRDINLKVSKGSLVAIVGSVGSGKTSLLSALLGDIPKIKGHVRVCGKLAYVSQDAWIQNATVQDNVTFGNLHQTEIDEALYKKALSVCQLQRDIEILPNGDQTEIGEKGINLSGGQKQRVSLARAVYSDSDVYLLDDCLSAVDAEVGRNIFENCILGSLSTKTRIFVTHQLQYLSKVDHIVVLEDGRIKEAGSYDQLMDTKGTFYDMITEHVTKHRNEPAPVTPDEIVATVESKPIEKKPKKAADESPSSGRAGGRTMTKEDRETGKVSWKVYWKYISAVGGFLIFAAVIGSYASEASFKMSTDIWLSRWATHGTTSGHGSSYYLSVYFTLGMTVCAFVMSRAFLVFFGALNASKKLHNTMLHQIVRSPMSFFDTTPIGRILNRFAKDQQVVDEKIPETISGFLNMGFGVISVIVIVGVSTPFFLTLLVPLSALYRYIQKYYIKSSRELRRMEAIARSPIFAQLGETLQGVKTIRAYHLKNEFAKSHHVKIDHAQRVTYLNVFASRWLAVRMELIGSSVVSLAALFAVLQRNSMDAGLAGLTIVYCLRLTQMMNWIIRGYTQLETDMVSVERLKSYSDLKSEAPDIMPGNRPPENWPTLGGIAFANVQLRYREGLPLVLNGTTFEIKPREKVGIVGRTGAGKSSLMLALFRLVELSGGTIIIDGIDISGIGLSDLRAKLSMIPQDPTLFEGTIRTNLDPFQEYPDPLIWQTLESVHMKQAVEELPDKLESSVSECGQNFSTGQRQLLCLGRALLKKSKILVMDEATASVDFNTDALIQKTIRKEFKDITVLTIAHRLNTILDSDRVMVMESGSVAEFDNPQTLLSNPNSKFYGLLHQQSNH